MVQLREKDLPGGELLELATSIKRAINGRALLIINERADVALAAGADGVQLGEEAFPLAAARCVVGPQFLLGRSVHSVDGAIQAQTEGTHFLIVGTMFATPSHPGTAPAGPRILSDIAELLKRRATPVPLIGIGGITETNLGEVMRVGASGIAVISSILGSSEPKEQATKLKRTMLDIWKSAPPVLTGGVGGASVGV